MIQLFSNLVSLGGNGLLKADFQCINISPFGSLIYLGYELSHWTEFIPESSFSSSGTDIGNLSCKCKY